MAPADGASSSNGHDRGLTRRGLIGGAAAGGATLSLAGLTEGISPATAEIASSARPRGRSRRPVSGRLPDPKRALRRVDSLVELDAVECAAALRARLISSRELLGACRAQVARHEPALNAWDHLYFERARSAARRADAVFRRRGHSAPLLTGIPIGMKDIFAIKGLPLTASSRVLAGHVAPGDSTVWRLLSGQGVVLLGHTHAAEFAAWGWALQTKNPWRRTLIAPGSSTGSGVALAARMVPLTTGSDTSGSLRAPASAFGVSSLKPTFGLVSRNGMIPTAWTFDHLGPMARAARDLSLLLAFMAARDRRDPATFARGHGARYPLSARRGHRPLAGVRVGVPDQYFGGVEVAPGIESVLSDFRRELRSLGATLVHFRAPRSEIDNSLTDSGFAFGLNTVGAEAGVFHRQFFPEHKDEYTEHVRTVLTAVAAANPSASDYIEGQRQRAKLMSMWGQAFREHRLDAVLQPAAFLEMPTLEEAERDSSFWFRAGISIFEMWNYTGFPVLALPAGRSPASGMPVGVQLVGLPDTEARLLQIGIDCQAHYPHHRKKPPDIVQ